MRVRWAVLQCALVADRAHVHGTIRCDSSGGHRRLWGRRSVWVTPAGRQGGTGGTRGDGLGGGRRRPGRKSGQSPEGLLP